MMHTRLWLRVRTQVLISFFLYQTYVVGAQKNRLNETILLNAQNIGEEIFTSLFSKNCLSKLWLKS